MAVIPCTPDDVRAINGTTLADEAIQPFIDTAVVLLNQVELCMNGKGITDAGKTQASAYLAAHLMSLSGVGQSGGSAGVKKREKFENYDVEYLTGSYDSSGILSTPYGSIANALSGGCLQEVDKRNASIGFYGGA